MGTIGNLIAWARRFRTAEAGVAAVEFALIVPVMLMVYIGMVEGSAMISMDRKIQSVSGAVGDLIARSDGEITAATVNDYVKIAGGIMTPYPSAPLVQIVSQVEVRADGSTRVDWSRRYVHQLPQPSGAHTVGAAYNTLPDEIIEIARGKYVIVAESSYAYRPLYGIVFDQAVNLYRENFYLPRFGTSIALLP